MTINFFSPLSFVAVFGFGIRDPESGIQVLRSGMGKNLLLQDTVDTTDQGRPCRISPSVIRIRFRIQGFDDQKLQKIQLKKITFFGKKLQFTYP
jgi:hypothetical protein